jgi:homocysteine S-methyltransferase
VSRRCSCPFRVGACSAAVRRAPYGERAGRAVRGGRFYSGVVSWFVADDTVLVADGGLATELEARGNDLSDSLWSARLLADAPEQILDAHLAFFRAGR